MHHRFLLVALFVLVSLGEKSTRTSSAQGTTYIDPFAYCAAVGTIDAPDARYAGPQVPDAVVRGLQAALQLPSNAPTDRLRATTSWRCMDGQVYACTVGANLPCWEKANTSQTPTADMATYCQANANADAIPAFVTGRATIYTWSCQNGVATPGRQVTQVDAQGFPANIWYAISAQGATGAQTMPQAGGTGLFGDRSGVLLLLGAMVALLGLLVRRRSVAY